MMPSFAIDARITFLKLIRRFLSKRNHLSYYYIRGTGLEIGALAHPLPVTVGVTVRYVDKVDRDEAVSMNPNIDPSRLVTPEIIDDGFTLSSIPDASEDFLIANHVLEHTPDPVHALMNWSRILKPEGILYITVPLAACSFDVGRQITSPAHMLEDYTLVNRGAFDIFDVHNREHFAEWIKFSEPNIYRKRDSNYVYPSLETIQNRLHETSLADTNELHFHTFTHQSFQEFLHLVSTKIDSSLQLIKIQNNFTEVIAILGKKV